jgi:renalase
MDTSPGGRKQSRDVIIVGAGLSGIAAGRQLAAAGVDVTLLDKGRSVGGRLATRRIGGGSADHGAQFFTARTPAMVDLVEKMMADGHVKVWSHGWSDGSLSEAPDDGFPRYVCTGGMNRFARLLAENLEVHTSVKVESVSLEEERWVVRSDDGDAWDARAVVLTAPVPQSLAVVDMGHVTLPPLFRKALERIRYAPCVTGLFVVDGDVLLPEPGAIQRPRATISWIADNQRKGISSGARVITVHAAPGFSRKLATRTDEEALVAIRAGLLPHLADGSRIVAEQLKRWRYADPEILHPLRYLLAREKPPLLFTGDAFAGPRIEGALLSGWASADALADHL